MARPSFPPRLFPPDVRPRCSGGGPLSWPLSPERVIKHRRRSADRTWRLGFPSRTMASVPPLAEAVVASRPHSPVRGCDVVLSRPVLGCLVCRRRAMATALSLSLKGDTNASSAEPREVGAERCCQSCCADRDGDDAWHGVEFGTRVESGPEDQVTGCEHCESLHVVSVQ